jgi:hypothetical protein
MVSALIRKNDSSSHHIIGWFWQNERDGSLDNGWPV